MSAVIYAAIVVMWAVVLVPMWLRRHDAATESRSVDRFSTAMRILSRRTAGGPDRRYVLMPRREETVSVHVSGASAPRPAPRRERPARPARPVAARSSLVARRRRTLLVLLGLAGLILLLAVAGVASWLLQVVADVALAGYVAHLRNQARRAAAVPRQRRRATVAPAPAPKAAPAPPAAPAGVPAPAPQPVAPPVAPAAAAAAAPVAAPADLVAEAVPDPAAVEPTGTDDAAATWEPVPVPPPTYTMKPPAPATPPVPPPTVADAPAAEIDDDRYTDLDEILEHRWAVND